MNRIFDAALYHHGQGCAVLAVSQNKVPYHKGWDRWFNERQTEQEVREEFANGAHGLGVFMWPGSSYTALDFDGAHAEAAWQATGIELPETAKNHTRSGGFHLIFRMPDGGIPGQKRKIRIVRADCDCKKDGKPKPCGVDLLVNGFACFPPTPGYREDPDHPLEDAVTLPLDVIEFAQKHQEKKQQTGKTDGKITQGERNSTLVSMAGTMRARGMSVEAIRAALTAENENCCEPPLEDDEIEDIIKSVTKWEQGTVTQPFNLTDFGNAERLIRLYGEDMRFCSQLGWLAWDDRRWAKDKTGQIERWAKATVRSIYNEAAHCEDEALRKALASHAKSSEAERKIKAAISLAKSEPGIPLRAKDLDRDSWLLNVMNGTLDLRTGGLRPHRQEDLITKLAPGHYDPTATCPTWDSFLDRIFDGNKGIITFLQRAVGYGLTGDVSEQVLFLLYGTGANGKSTFLNAIREALGEYAKQAAPDLLVAKRGVSHPTEIADIVGCRFLTSIEVEDGRRLAEALVKQITGGDPIKGRFMNKDFFEFMPTHKIFMAVNHKPVIRGTDSAIWRRIRLVPFTVTFPEDEQDKKLPEKLKAELPGIFNWTVQGCLAWQREGLGIP
ncbi:MAG: phage/plasmid primase, P4 family, partial [Deltaproteobacteria bacterium]|nr:phage/plasmid primase, P4 family [Deltaproteobacteria bacterium]